MKKRILFQGDSITDCGRYKDIPQTMGWGYANLVKSSMGLDEPDQYEFINRGIGGNRIVDLYARIKSDFINLKPDYASILIGVNDSWHEILENNGVDSAKFEKIYTMLVEEVLEACPGIKLMILSAYVTEGTRTCNTEEFPDRLDRFQKDVGEKAAAAKRIAAKFNLPLVDLQAAFDEACKIAPADCWTEDGVHPTAAGHELIKREWIKAFQSMK